MTLEVAKPSREKHCSPRFLIAIVFSCLAALQIYGEVNNSAETARKSYLIEQARLKRNPKAEESLWHFARACFDLADVATNSSERALIAEQGIAACREIISSNSASAPAHYYLGMNLGELAQTKGLGALKIVDLMEREFLSVQREDEKFDYGGADRNLGLLYRDAPSFASIGSRTRAKQHLQKAVQLAPEYPENHLNLAESCLKWEDRNCVLRELKSLESGWAEARTKFAGPEWAQSWIDWKKRLQSIKKKIEDGSHPFQSPHNN